MPAPQATQIHIDQALTNFSQLYANEDYIADQIMPMVPVNKRSDKWFVYGKEHFRYRNAIRQPGALADEFDYSLSTSSYFAQPRAERHLVLDDDVMEQDDPLNEELDAAELLMELFMLIREVDVANFLTNTANLTNNTALSGTTQWSDYTNSVPLTNIKTAKASVRTNAAKRANVVLFPYETALVLADHPSIKDLTKYTDPKGLMESGLPATVRGLRVIEPGAVQDTSIEGRAFSPAAAWGKNAIIGYVNPYPGRKKISMAYMFVAPEPTSRTPGFATRKYREDARKGLWVETEISYSLNMVAPGAGFLFTTCIA
jgi:hypothetical protein